MKIEWEYMSQSTRLEADLDPFPVSLRIWYDAEEKGWFGSIELDFLKGAYYPVTTNDGRTFANQEIAKFAVERELGIRIDKLKSAFDGVVWP